jgi:hypothetical protein
VHLRDGLVLRGRRFYDQAELFRALSPEMAWLTQLSTPSGTTARSYRDVMPDAAVDPPFAADARIEIAGQRRVLAPAELPKSDAIRAVDWAANDDLAFIEWQSDELLGVDRLELKDGRIVSQRRYFDTLGLLAKRDPSVTALRARLLANAR